MWSDEIGGVPEEPSMWPWYTAGVFLLTLIMCLLVNTIHSIFQRAAPDLRSMTPLQIWISILPVFGSIWIFYVIYQLANALREEFKRRKLVEFETSPGLGVGWAFAFFMATAHLTLLIDEPVITTLLYLVAVVLLIIYWVKIFSFRGKLDRDSMGSTQFQNPFPYQQPHQNTQQQWPPQGQTFYPPPNPQQYTPPPPQQDDWDRWRPK